MSKKTINEDPSVFDTLKTKAGALGSRVGHSFLSSLGAEESQGKLNARKVADRLMMVWHDYSKSTKRDDADELRRFVQAYFGNLLHDVEPLIRHYEKSNGRSTPTTERPNAAPQRSTSAPKKSNTVVVDSTGTPIVVGDHVRMHTRHGVSMTGTITKIAFNQALPDDSLGKRVTIALGAENDNVMNVYQTGPNGIDSSPNRLVKYTPKLDHGPILKDTVAKLKEITTAQYFHPIDMVTVLQRALRAANGTSEWEAVKSFVKTIQDDERWIKRIPMLSDLIMNFNEGRKISGSKLVEYVLADSELDHIFLTLAKSLIPAVNVQAETKAFMNKKVLPDGFRRAWILYAKNINSPDRDVILATLGKGKTIANVLDSLKRVEGSSLNVLMLAQGL